MPDTTALDPGRDPPTALGLFLVFARIGLTSFGGGLSGWLLREFVVKRRWISEEEFLNGLALSQALPGVNVTNMAIWIGYRLCGTAGAVAGVAGIVVPSAILIVALATGFRQLDRFPATHVALAGAAAAAIGLSLTMAITTVRAAAAPRGADRHHGARVRGRRAPALAAALGGRRVRHGLGRLCLVAAPP